MVEPTRLESRSALVVDHFMPEDNHHPLLGFYVFQSRRKYFGILFGVAFLSALFAFLLTSTLVSARSVNVTFTPSTSTNKVTTPPVTVKSNSSGQVALSENQLRNEVRKVGGAIFWAGSETGAKYTYNHRTGQDYIRYLTNGNGLSDTTQNYRVIATYQDPNAYATILTASKLASGVGINNADGSLIYYAKATPTHVYMAFKGFNYQVEIFDPRPGQSLKLATTPGAILKVI